MQQAYDKRKQAPTMTSVALLSPTQRGQWAAPALCLALVLLLTRAHLNDRLLAQGQGDEGREAPILFPTPSKRPFSRFVYKKYNLKPSMFLADLLSS